MAVLASRLLAKKVSLARSGAASTKRMVCHLLILKNLQSFGRGSVNEEMGK
jgi:hypothetical protein